jgi:hypothetical protein
MIKLNVILDLDNTIINTVGLDIDSNLINKFEYVIYQVNTFERALIFKRPHLDEFLNWLFENCNVSVFTHADKDYAMYVVDNFIYKGKTNRKLDFIFYRYHVELGLELYKGYKDLRLLWNYFKIFDFYPINTVIIDDNLLVKKTNKYNCISISPFDVSIDSINDNHLLKVKREIERLTIKYNKLVNSGVEYNHMKPILYEDDKVDEVY